MTFLIFIIWYIIGIGGFIYWWTKKFDFTSDEIPECILCGFAGPISWIIGLYIHSTKKIIIKSNKRNNL